MIVLDEQLRNSGVEEACREWYRGRVRNIASLRPGTVIKDDAIPVLLRRVPGTTFVTINVSDFWRRQSADRHYCLACFPLPDDRTDEIAGSLRRLFRVSSFATKQARCGKVARVAPSGVRYYAVGERRTRFLPWPD